MYARIQNGIVMEIISFSPEGCFTEELVVKFVGCDETVNQGDTYENGIFTKPLIIIDPKQEILYKLSQLDKIISREIEQTYIDMGKLPSYQPMLDALIEKQYLRKQLL